LFFGLPDFFIFDLFLVILPLALVIVGLSWILASLGVYLRDVSQIIGVVTTVLMFLSPIFYPVVSLPEEYRPFMELNPITFVVEQARDVMIWSKDLDWSGWAFQMLFSTLVAWLGFAWFQKTRKGFADVL